MKRYIRSSSGVNVPDEISGTIQVKPDVDVNVVVNLIKKFNVVENIDVSGDVIKLSGKYNEANKNSWYLKLNNYIVSGEMLINHVSLGYTTSMSFHPSTSKYSLSVWRVSDNVDPVYIISLDNLGSGKYSASCSSAYRADGTKKVLHDEMAVTFNLVNGEPQILSGWHIGTQDFNFRKGADWEDCVERYQPGITEQILERIKNNDYGYH